VWPLVELIFSYKFFISYVLRKYRLGRKRQSQAIPQSRQPYSNNKYYLSNSLIVQVEVRFWGCHNYYLFAASYLVRNNTLNDEVQPENW
jgi:hypothetical protein